jgi:endonuclease YncB( thermonuclease family)
MFSCLTYCCFKQQYLKNIKYADTVLFIPSIHYCKVVKVYDGDTITVATTLPLKNDSRVFRFRVRLRHIDSPEIKGSTPKEKQLAIKARDALHAKIFDKIVRLENNGTEKWGRVLADVYYDDIYINQWMLDNNFAVPYEGGTKQKIVEDPNEEELCELNFKKME